MERIIKSQLYNTVYLERWTFLGKGLNLRGAVPVPPPNQYSRGYCPPPPPLLEKLRTIEGIKSDYGDTKKCLRGLVPPSNAEGVLRTPPPGYRPIVRGNLTDICREKVQLWGNIGAAGDSCQEHHSAWERWERRGGGQKINNFFVFPFLHLAGRCLSHKFWDILYMTWHLWENKVCLLTQAAIYLFVVYGYCHKWTNTKGLTFYCYNFYKF